MEADQKAHIVDREVVYIFDKERELQMLVSCFKICRTSKIKRSLSMLYVTIIWLFLFYEMCMGFYSSFLTMGNRTQMLETLHMALLTFYAITHLSNKLASDFNAVLEIVNKGFYTYEEEIDESHYEIKREHVKRIRLVNKWFRRIIMASGVNFLLFNTTKKYIETLYKNQPSEFPTNPYLPISFYVPFDTSTVPTFTIAYLCNMLVMFSICMVTIGIDEIFVSLIGQLKAQLEILNLSISKVVERALQRYTHDKVGTNLQDLYQRKEFQDCLMNCLRENIRHHHVLLRFTELIRNYIQMTFLLIVVLASIILALSTLVITKSKLSGEELLGVATFVLMLLTELVFVLQFCLYGEEISNESSRLFFTLWSTPWWCFDKRVKKVLSIMMLNTKKPITLKTYFLNLSTSLESFSEIISRAYQVGNVMLNI